MYKFIFSLFLLLIPGLCPATTILIMGDSISAAYGMKLDQGWVTLLQQKLNEETPDVKLINASISGELTAGGLARIDQELTRHHPKVVIIELGGNDGLRGFSPKIIKNNLTEMIKQAETIGAKVILLGMRIPPNYGKQYTEMFAAVYRQLEKEHKVSLVPFLLDGIGTNSELMQYDGIHPNAKAQSLIMEMVWTKLQPLIEDQVD